MEYYPLRWKSTFRKEAYPLLVARKVRGTYLYKKEKEELIYSVSEHFELSELINISIFWHHCPILKVFRILGVNGLVPRQVCQTLSYEKAKVLPKRDILHVSYAPNTGGFR